MLELIVATSKQSSFYHQLSNETKHSDPHNIKAIINMLPSLLERGTRCLEKGTVSHKSKARKKTYRYSSKSFAFTRQVIRDLQQVAVTRLQSSISLFVIFDLPLTH